MAHKPYERRKDTPARRKNTLPLLLLGGALVLILVGVFTLLRQPSTPARPVEVSGQPKLVVDREQIDFGKVPMDKPVLAEFELSNAGDQPLQLAEIPQVEVREGC